MKEYIIIIIILLIIIVGEIGIQSYLNASSNKLIDKINDISNLVKNEEFTGELNKKCDELYNDWKKTEKKWSIIVLHNELDLIEEALIETKMNIKEKNFIEGKVEIERSIFLISHIPEKEKISLKNVF